MTTSGRFAEEGREERGDSVVGVAATEEELVEGPGGAREDPEELGDIVVDVVDGHARVEGSGGGEVDGDYEGEGGEGEPEDGGEEGQSKVFA